MPGIKRPPPDVGLGKTAADGSRTRDVTWEEAPKGPRATEETERETLETFSGD